MVTFLFFMSLKKKKNKNIAQFITPIRRIKKEKNLF